MSDSILLSMPVPLRPLAELVHDVWWSWRMLDEYAERVWRPAGPSS